MKCTIEGQNGWPAHITTNCTMLIARQARKETNMCANKRKTRDFGIQPDPMILKFNLALSIFMDDLIAIEFLQILVDEKFCFVFVTYSVLL